MIGRVCLDRAKAYGFAMVAQGNGNDPGSGRCRRGIYGWGISFAAFDKSLFECDLLAQIGNFMAGGHVEIVFSHGDTLLLCWILGGDELAPKTYN